VDRVKQIQQFVTSDLPQLSTQLSKFENNVATETQDIRNTFDAIPVPQPEVLEGGGIFTVGQCVFANTVHGAFSINLAAPNNGLPGRMMVIRTASPALTVVPITGLVNLSTSAVVPGIATIYFDGANWWF
jgi:hypothetical protein